MQAKCPHCQTVLDVSQFATGTVITCANCQQNLTVPAPVAQPASVAVPTGLTRRAKAREKQWKGSRKLLLVIAAICLSPPVLLLIVSVIVPAKLLTPAEQAKQRAEGQILAAFGRAKYNVQMRLRSPSTADFGRQSASICVSRGENGMYTVNGYVDAQNGFGATVRQRFTVVLKTAESGLIPISVEIF